MTNGCSHDQNAGRDEDLTVWQATVSLCVNRHLQMTEKRRMKLRKRKLEDGVTEKGV